MQATILDATENATFIEKSLHNILTKHNIQISYFKLKDLHILPCGSCGSCGIRTPGRCVLKDDMTPIFKAIANSYLLVYLTPIRFGGYSSELKKAIDRTMLLGMPFYIVKKGHLLHPMRYDEKYILGVGYSENGQTDEENNFKNLVFRNAVNMSSKCETLVWHSADTAAQIETGIENILKGVR